MLLESKAPRQGQESAYQ